MGVFLSLTDRLVALLRLTGVNAVIDAYGSYGLRLVGADSGVGWG
jgi:hypothetical protein